MAVFFSVEECRSIVCDCHSSRTIGYYRTYKVNFASHYYVNCSVVLMDGKFVNRIEAVDGTAHTGKDFVAISQGLVFEPHQTERTVEYYY